MPPASSSALFVEIAGVLVVDGPVHPLLAPGVAAYLRRMAIARVPVIAIAGDGDAAALLTRLCVASDVAVPRLIQPEPGRMLTAKRLLTSAREHGADPTASWLVCRDPALLAPAATAGLYGAALVGADPPADDAALLVRRAESFADAPRVMAPRDGGCWHTI